MMFMRTFGPSSKEVNVMEKLTSRNLFQYLLLSYWDTELIHFSLSGGLPALLPVTDTENTVRDTKRPRVNTI